MPTDEQRTQYRALYINDFDVSRLGFVVGDVIEKHRGGLTFPDRTSGLPGHVGTIALAREWESTPRRVVVTGMQDGPTVSQLVEDVNDLKQRCFEGSVELRFVDDANKVYYARCEDFDTTMIGPALARGAGARARHRIRITFLCQDPLIYDRNGSVIGFSTAKAEVPLGTAPSLPLIRVNGPTTCGFVYTYSDFTGVSQATLALSTAVELSSTQYMLIDHELSSITSSTGGDFVSSFSTGSEFFAFDPQHGAGGTTGPWPTLQIDSTGSTGLTADALFKRAYL